jgi:hypothetical protein
MQKTKTQVRQDKRAAALRDNLRKRKALAKDKNQKDTTNNDTDKPNA